MSSPSWRLSNPIGSFLAIVVLPLALVAFGIWQHQMAAADFAEWKEGATGRRYLALIVVVAGATTAVLGPLFMLAARALGRAGLRSRPTLITGYCRVRRALPPLMILLLIASPASFIAAAYGELLSGDPRRMWLALPLLCPAVPGSFGTLLLVLWGEIIGLRPSPDPALVPGRPVSRAEAPGLWQLATALAGQLGAQPPDLIMVGLTNDFSLIAAPVLAEGTKHILQGNALYVPLPYLAFHREDEVAAIIGYEIAHFAGEDTGHTNGLALMQADIGRSMGDLLKKSAEQDADTLSLLIWPAPHIGLYAMGQFLSALQSWHRHRVFAADAAVATLVSPATMARALLRREAVRRPIRDALKLAWNKYEEARADYFITFALAHAAQRGLDAPTRGGRGKDPSIRERVLALGQTPSNMIAEARAQPEPEAAARLGLYLADPEATVRDATKRFVARGAPGRPIVPDRPIAPP